MTGRPDRFFRCIEGVLFNHETHGAHEKEYSSTGANLLMTLAEGFLAVKQLCTDG